MDRSEAGNVTDVNLINAEVLRVGPDEVLIIRLPQDTPLLRVSPDDPDIVDGLLSAIEQVGLGGRVMIMQLDARWQLCHARPPRRWRGQHERSQLPRHLGMESAPRCLDRTLV